MTTDLLVWLKLPVAVATFLLPGWLLGRKLGSPAPVLTSFFGSAILWFHLVLAYDLAGAWLTAGHLLGGWITICVALAWWAWKPAPAAPAAPEYSLRPRGAAWFWIAAAAIGFASIAARAVIDPLSGWDNGFRWDYLARTMVAHGRIDFYPPVKAEHFEIYAWCDGIPPLVPFLNAWLYLTTGAISPVVTAVRIIGEALLIGSVVFRLGRELWGEPGGWPAIGLLGTSALFLWAASMGQETGLLALALAALIWLLERHARDPRPSTALWAGVAAAIGAASREYGLVLVPFGLAVLLLRGPRRQGAGTFLVTATSLSAPWYLRNLALTGNPLFPQPLGGLFPTNAFYADVTRSIGNYWSLGSPHVKFGPVAALLSALAGGVLAAGLLGAVRAGRKAAVPLAGLLLFSALWLWSVPQTGGGLNYSLRVLAPAVALGAGLAGGLGTLPAGWMRTTALGVTLLLSCDAARRAWFLPVFPLARVLPWTFEPWRLERDGIRQIRNYPLWDFLIRAAQGGLIAVDHPSSHEELARRGGRTAMLFSPVFAPCFQADLPFDDAVRELRAAGVRLMALSTSDPIMLASIRQHPFFHTLIDRRKPFLQFELLSVFNLDDLALTAAVP